MGFNAMQPGKIKKADLIIGGGGGLLVRAPGVSGGGDRSDWVRNLMISPEVTLQIGERRKTTKARVVTDPDEDRLAQRLVVDKYTPRYRGDLTDWGKTSLPVAIQW